MGFRLPGVVGGGDERIRPETRFECGVCWYVYDPAQGCETWDIPPGTPFTALPDHWSCPQCDNNRAVFLPLDDQQPQIYGLEQAVAALSSVFTQAAQRMSDLPVYNPALTVQAVGFAERTLPGLEECWLGILVTPWFMNAILLPRQIEDWASLVPGATKISRALPSGLYEFEVASQPGVERYLSLSLFSPMIEFADTLGASETARACLEELLKAPPSKAEEAPPPPPQTAEVNRRDLLRGRLRPRDGT